MTLSKVGGSLCKDLQDGAVVEKVVAGKFGNVSLFTRNPGVCEAGEDRNFFRVPVTQLLPFVGSRRGRFVLEGVEVKFPLDVSLRTEVMGICYQWDGYEDGLVEMDGPMTFRNGVESVGDGPVVLFGGRETGLMDNGGPFGTVRVGNRERMDSVDGSLFGCELVDGRRRAVGRMSYGRESMGDGRMFYRVVEPGRGTGIGGGIEFERHGISMKCELGMDYVLGSSRPLMMLVGIRGMGQGRMSVQYGNVGQAIVKLRYRGPS